MCLLKSEAQYYVCTFFALCICEYFCYCLIYSTTKHWFNIQYTCTFWATTTPPTHHIGNKLLSKSKECICILSDVNLMFIAVLESMHVMCVCYIVTLEKERFRLLLFTLRLVTHMYAQLWGIPISYLCRIWKGPHQPRMWFNNNIMC